jgi:hypothetical protein
MAKNDDNTIERAYGETIPVGEPAEKQPAEGSLKNADQTSNPVHNDAEPNDPPVRTNRPDTPVLTTLAVGAGAHEAVSDPEIDVDGRFVPKEAQVEDARSAEAAARTKAATKSSS